LRSTLLDREDILIIHQKFYDPKIFQQISLQLAAFAVHHLPVSSPCPGAATTNSCYHDYVSIPIEDDEQTGSLATDRVSGGQQLTEHVKLGT
jgi:hypothetical protein